MFHAPILAHRSLGYNPCMKLPVLPPAKAENVRHLARLINLKAPIDLSAHLAKLSDDERDHLLELTRTSGRAAHMIPRRKRA